ncbi:AtpZ/AtpI family protein [Fertoebacter nigrum]|uniref:ATP synthase protein I n=1 Tax=Fertoeibacter niger TaxID=2656921 RepID=A0A8X8H397_9RHOB|nr:AtpZ/AtpI family protein [Fertoeibacter niger]NUB44813.1 AtpZ/AtpI family protein [Fertoeibacter niger]
MSDDPDPERLRALGARISRVKGTAKVRTETGKGFSQGEVGWRMVIELVTGMLLGLSIGYGLDWVFGTLPIFLVIFAMLGFGAGVKTMLGTARQMAAEQDKTAGKPAAGEGD